MHHDRLRETLNILPGLSTKLFPHGHILYQPANTIGQGLWIKIFYQQAIFTITDDIARTMRTVE